MFCETFETIRLCGSEFWTDILIDFNEFSIKWQMPIHIGDFMIIKKANLSDPYFHSCPCV